MDNHGSGQGGGEVLVGFAPLPDQPWIGDPAWRPPLPRRRVALPLALFLATCVSTFWAGATNWMPILYMDGFDRAGAALAEHWRQGLLYMAAVLAVLVAHEMGHFLVAVRHRIATSYPYFLPVPISPLGTMGAVIGIRGGLRADRRQLFDLGLAGPLAGLAVALPILWIGARQFDPGVEQGLEFPFPCPLLLQFILRATRPDCPAEAFTSLKYANPWLVAGWAAMLVTGLNMIPVGQLDGGHVAHALVGRRAVWLARGFLLGGILFILISEQYAWVLMILIVTLIGVDHPPSSDDHAVLGWPRRLVGWASLVIPFLCLPSWDLV